MSFIIPGKGKINNTDEDLISEFTSQGDLEVLGILYSRYMHLVYGVCLKYLKNSEESKDAVMQIFEKLIAEIPKQRIENFKSWLHVVTKNYCLMQLRSQKSQTERLHEWRSDTVAFMEINSDLHPIDSENWDIDLALADCIEKLKEEQKDCIRQFYFENRCYNEIASTLDLDVKEVKSHLQNAKRNLKICLEKEHEGQK